MPDEPGYWAVLTHADLTAVAREPVLYSASEGGVVLENLDPENLERMRGMLLAMDPPRHIAYRRPLAPSFKARVIGGLEGRIREISREIMASAKEQRDLDFVHDVATLLPSQVVGELMGLPREDWPSIQAWAEQNTSGQDPDIVGETDAYAADGDANMQMAMYAMQFAAQRRTEAPREDLTSLILAGNFGDGPMTDLDFGIFFVQLVTAGNDTTKTMLSSGLLALLEHPEQLAALRADPSLIPGAVEEILRYENPLHYFRRTATADSVLHDTEIAAGEKVAMYYTVGEPRPRRVRRPAPLRHLAVAQPAPVVRDRRALLPRRAPRPARRPGVLRGGARHLLADRRHRRAGARAEQPQQRAQALPGAPHRLILDRPKPPDGSVQNTATGFTGHPVPPGIRNGAMVRRNSHRSCATHAGTSRERSTLSTRCSPMPTMPIWCTGNGQSGTPRPGVMSEIPSPARTATCAFVEPRQGLGVQAGEAVAERVEPPALRGLAGRRVPRRR